MKTSTILTLLLFAFATKTSLLALASTPVVDSDGHKVQPGVEYYVVSWIWGAGGGGLYLAFDPVHSCPEIVAQHGWDSQYGIPVTFSSVDGKDVVYENAKVTVTFIPLRPKLCTTTTTWQVVDDKPTGKKLVTLGGVEGKSATVFTLKNHAGWAYRFNYQGSDIGRTSDKHGYIRLAVDNKHPWEWVFKKAKRSKTIKQVVNA